jgi:predicted SAM-dependent methyltransferase
LYKRSACVTSLITDKGPVEYHFQSMTDLSAFSEDSFDLVYAGQSMEHVTESDADLVLAEARRVLRPGGHLCIDTPNGAACRLQLAGTGRCVTNPDHKIEYTDKQLRRKIEAAGFKVASAQGLNYIPKSFKEGWVMDRELAGSTGIFNTINECYILAYVCTLET